MNILIISGISGSGKSLACNTLEDLGYFCIDNLPAQLLPQACKINNSLKKKMAIVVDSRSQDYSTLNEQLDRLDADKVNYKLLFIYSEADVIMNRFKQTRRKHPLISEQIPSLEEAIQKEYTLCKPIQERADYQIDTTYLTAAKLKKSLSDLFGEEGYEGMTIKLVSFGYRNGLPNEADIVVDVRCLPNPFYIPEMRNLSGLDDEVYNYVFSFEQSRTMGEKLMEYLEYFLPYYMEEGKTELVIALGCTSGHHRSVSFVRYMQEKCRVFHNKVVVIHRDIEKDY
mgnify:CR=1 FL=1